MNSRNFWKKTVVAGLFGGLLWHSTTYRTSSNDTRGLLFGRSLIISRIKSLSVADQINELIVGLIIVFFFFVYCVGPISTYWYCNVPLRSDRKYGNGSKHPQSGIIRILRNKSVYPCFCFMFTVLSVSRLDLLKFRHR